MNPEKVTPVIETSEDFLLAEAETESGGQFAFWACTLGVQGNKQTTVRATTCATGQRTAAL
jgi:hypothetical protein